LELNQDQQLLQRIGLGEEEAFDTLFRRYYAPLCAYAAKLTDGNREDAEDIVQQAFIKLWEQRNALSIQWSVKAYMYKTVHNRCLNRIRDRRLRERHHENLKDREDSQETMLDELSSQLQKALGNI
jgi:RNA polymerase sigma factor (sigma-70 family)